MSTKQLKEGGIYTGSTLYIFLFAYIKEFTLVKIKTVSVNTPTR